MDADLKNFVQPISRVVAATAFAVFTVAFFSLPYVLQQHPGDPQVPSQQTTPRHMT